MRFLNSSISFPTEFGSVKKANGFTGFSIGAGKSLISNIFELLKICVLWFLVFFLFENSENFKKFSKKTISQNTNVYMKNVLYHAENIFIKHRRGDHLSLKTSNLGIHTQMLIIACKNIFSKFLKIFKNENFYFFQFFCMLILIVKTKTYSFDQFCQ